jgi:hypothetical protein
MKHSNENANNKTNPAGKTITALWLIIFYVSSIWLVLGTLSARNFQDKVNSLIQEKAEKNYTFMTIIKIMSELDDKAKMRQNIQRLIESTESDLKKLTDERSSKYQHVNELQSKSDSMFVIIKKKFETQGIMQVSRDLSLPNEQVDALIEKDTELKALLEGYKEIIKQQAGLENELELLENSLVDTKDHLTLYRTEDTDLFSAQNTILSRNFEVADHLNDFSYLRRMHANFIAIMPDQLLTLILSLSMGALGSVIYLTRTYLNPTVRKPFTWYLFRPFLGAVTALAIFILAKAGQITISDVSISEGLKEALNPFFISFLAIISGLLSEQAIEKIRSAGAAIFRTEPVDQMRWAVGVKSTLKAQGKSLNDLLPYVTSPSETVEDWIEERSPVQPEDQRIISTFLAIPIRKLFTDLPPP